MPSIRTVAAVVALFVCASASTSRAQSASRPAATIAATQPVLDQAALEKQFEQTMSGAVLVGPKVHDLTRPQERRDTAAVAEVEGGI